MTAEEAIDIAKAFGVSRGRPFTDHTFEPVFVPSKELFGTRDHADDVWDVWVIYNPLKGIMPGCVVEVNCRTREATLILMA